MARTKKAPCVDMEIDIMKDERFEVLGEIAGYNRFEAIGRMYALWAWCTERAIKKAADWRFASYAVIRRYLGPKGVEALLGDGVDEFALGAEASPDNVRVEGALYIRGTHRMGWSVDLAATASPGGQARAAAADRDDEGRFVSAPTVTQQIGTDYPARLQPSIQRHPASSTSPSPSYSEDPSPARVIHIQAAQPAPTRHTFVAGAWAYGADQHAKLRGEGIWPNAKPWSRSPIGEGERQFEARIAEITKGDPAKLDEARAVVKRVIDFRVAEARARGTLEWFIPTRVFASEGFWKAAEQDLSVAGKAVNLPSARVSARDPTGPPVEVVNARRTQEKAETAKQIQEARKKAETAVRAGDPEISKLIASVVGNVDLGAKA